MSNSKLGTFEAIMSIVSVIIVHTILSLSKALVDSMKSAVILNVIYVSIIVVAFILLICNLLKKFPGMDLLDISETLGGAIFKRIIGAIFITYFAVSSSILLRNFCECLKIINYPATNIIFIISFILISISIVNNLAINTNFKSNLIVLPVILISMLFLFFANLNHFDTQRIFPILGEGLTHTFIVGISNISSFGGIVFIYFIPPLLKEPKHLKKIAISSVIVSAIYLILTVSIILFMFISFQNTYEVMPLYSATAYIEFGTFFQRLDSVFLFIWTIAFACYLSLISKFSIHILQKITLIKNVKAITYPYFFILLAVALIPKDYSAAKFYETNIYPYFVIGLVFILSLFILIFAYLKRKKVGDYNKQNN